ncbi:DUF4281 domain-containing protein [Erythrobacteraceae bacterium CFH 75059]|uniref:ABA4-like family protein n=1 Tax=Qipengyuania thermophila TaxID=2509361 RepID=UPI0010213103|nr:ABA4-like family protein [Qipengyuania thermophila]TCD04905.1 DUF4281 domain-containing protein [Erythrobacteraceae bacterium CFH 75059]
MWDALFTLTNALAMSGWAVLLLLPRREALLSAVLYLGVGVLCLLYAVLLLGLVSGVLDGGGAGRGLPHYSVDGLMQIFDTRGGLVIAWTHYLALDLFAGLWIARDADHKGIARWVQAPVLILTLVAGPAGLLTWLALRERRARIVGTRGSRR